MGVKTLAALPQLERLSLWNVKGIDDGAAAHWEALGTLASLDLSDTAVGDATLVRLSTLPNLRRLYVSETQVTPQGLAAFHSKRPSCVVSSGSRPAPRIPLNPPPRAEGALRQDPAAALAKADPGTQDAR
jgi:hypothetical protein